MATWLRWAALLSLVPEVFEVIYYHFPYWLDIALPVTFLVHQICAFVQRKTKMYAGDIL